MKSAANRPSNDPINCPIDYPITRLPDYPIRLSAVLGVLAVLIAGVVAQAPDDLVTVLGRVGDRVQHYYGRAQSIVCNERVTVQPMSHDLTPAGLGRVLEFELRIDWDASENDQPLEARVIRELRKVNGRAPRPNYEPGCLDPKSGALEPLAFLLPHHRGEYTFAWNGVGRLKNQRTVMLDYKSRAPGPIDAKWKGDCVSIDAPGRTKGRIWIDEGTHDVLRLDEQLTGQFEYRVPREHWGFNGPQTWVIERADSSIRYRPVAFRDPDEIVLLPESIEVVTIFRGAQSYRIAQTFSGYKRFITGGRVVK
jgi:hypothetical protein